MGLYDNLSDKADLSYTLPYERAGIVTRIQWRFCCGGDDNNQGQRGQMNHALYKFGQIATWLVDIDSDEFILTGGHSILSILARIDSHVHISGMESFITQPGCSTFGSSKSIFMGN